MARTTAAHLPPGDIWYSEYHTPNVKLSWKVNVLASEQSRFQKMVVMHNDDFGNMFTLDGWVQVTERDEFIYHDMIVHPALAVNPEIGRVLIIGAGDGGTAREVLRYRQIEKIDLVEIDEMVIRLSKKYLPKTSCSFGNPRLNLIIGDGLDLVRRTADAKYDLIIVDSTDPAGPGSGLFTLDFYRHCFRALAADGILINQHESAFYNNDFAELKRAHEKIAATFPIAEIYGFNIPTYSSGYWYFGFASKKLHPLADHQPERWEAFGLDTQYYNSAVHRGAFALPSYVQNRLTQDGEGDAR